MNKVYLDATKLIEAGITSVGVTGACEVILAGTTISTMDVSLKQEYQKYANNYDIQFIFNDRIPSIEFYTVPLIDIMAMDSMGGFIGTIEQQSDIESNAPICYISKTLECFIVSENGVEFLKNMKSWKKNLKPCDKITFYCSRQEAEKELRFIDLHKDQMNKFKR